MSKTARCYPTVVSRPWPASFASICDYLAPSLCNRLIAIDYRELIDPNLERLFSSGTPISSTYPSSRLTNLHVGHPERVTPNRVKQASGELPLKHRRENICVENPEKQESELV